MVLPWYDKEYFSQNTYFIKGGKILSLNELSETSHTTIILCNLLVYNFRKVFIIDQNLKCFLLTYYFDELFIFFLVTLFSVWSMLQISTARKHMFQMKQKIK